LVTDGENHIFLTAGNGTPAPVGPASTSTTTLGQTATRLDQQPDGTLTLGDYFGPYNAAVLNDRDRDLTSSPVALPDSMGVPGHPHLLVTAGKEGRIYLLDRDNLGGVGQGPD